MLKVLKSDSAARKGLLLPQEIKKANTFSVSQALPIQIGAAASRLSVGATFDGSSDLALQDHSAT